MKKMFTLALAAMGFAVITTGCVNTETNRVGDQVAVNMQLNITPQVEIKNNKIFGQAEVHSVLGIINWGVDSEATGVNFGASAAHGAGALGGAAGAFNAFSAFIPNGTSVAKNGAVYNACVTNKADLLLAPQYVIKTKNYFVYKVIECKVTGFPGTVKSLKVAK